MSRKLNLKKKIDPISQLNVTYTTHTDRPLDKVSYSNESDVYNKNMSFYLWLFNHMLLLGSDWKGFISELKNSYHYIPT